MPQLYNLNRVEKLILDYAKIPAPEELLNPVPEPVRDNAVNENVKAVMGQPLVAFPEQDHEAHIATHMAFMEHPMFGQNPSIMNGLMPTMVSHLRDHIGLWYVHNVVEMASQMAGMDFTKLMDKDEKVSQQVDRVLMMASQQVLQSSSQNQTIQQMSAVIQKAMQFVQQNQQPQPTDPTVVQKMEVERKKAADQQKLQMDQQRLAMDQQKHALDQQKMQADAQSAQAKAQADMAKSGADQQSAQIKAQEAQAKLAESQQRMQMDQAKLMADTEAQRQKAELEAQKIAQTAQLADSQQQNENLRAQAAIEADMAINTADNNTALRIAAAEIQSGEDIALSTGGGINPGN